jgi:hypothetical protein
MLWPGETFVDFAHGLNTSIRELRGALSDTERRGRPLPQIPPTRPLYEPSG